MPLMFDSCFMQLSGVIPAGLVHWNNYPYRASLSSVQQHVTPLYYRTKWQLWQHQHYVEIFETKPKTNG